MPPSRSLSVWPISAFADNYIWLLERHGRAVVVDPGDAAPVRAALKERQLALAAILVTHHHFDHTGGVASLRAEFDVPAYGPRAEAARIPALTHLLDDGERFRLPGIELEMEAWVLPGHTLGQCAFVSPELLFCGDTLFSAGCGRLFEGTARQMHASLSRLASLPPATAVYAGHEYTLANLAFAAAVEPDDADIRLEAERVAQLRREGRPSLPSSIERERRINPFLHCERPGVVRTAEARAGRALADPIEVFAVLRSWKDGFRAPAP